MGGEMYYECLDPAVNYYQFSVKLYRSCTVDEFGMPISIYFDQDIYISLYDSSNNLIEEFFMILAPTDTLTQTDYNGCYTSTSNNMCGEGFVSG